MIIALTLLRLVAQSARAVEYTASLQRVKTPPTSPVYDTKLSDDEVPAMLDLRGMRSTPSLPVFPGPL